MDRIYFTINGEHYSLAGSEVVPETSLNDYLRHYVNVRGTKAMCHEGGCGACIVSVSQTHPVTKERHVFSVNSCLVHILSCHQWDITTIEGVGNRRDGYHNIQTRLAAFNATQCGYCTPGWIMNMYSLYESRNHKLTSKQIENSFASNICRCTGYRPILDALKSFATDQDVASQGRVEDLEDLADLKCLKKDCNKSCTLEDKEWCIINATGHSEIFSVQLKGSRWYKAFKIQDVFSIFSKEGVDSYRLVAGNTGKGVFPIKEEARVLIDISSIEILKESTAEANLVLGAGMSLNEAMDTFLKLSNDSDFNYLKHLYDHLDLVAHVPVRNVGTIGGNLAMKNKHRGFPSDVFLLLETVQATVTMINEKLEKSEVSMNDFLKMDFKNKLIYNVKLPRLSSRYLFKSYKIMPRAQNAHAIMNAGFLFKVDSNAKVDAATIVYGCISPDFVNATRTSKYLIGKPLFDNATLQEALKILNEELIPVADPPEPSVFCRKMIAMGLFYKSILNLAPENKVQIRYKSGGTIIKRPVSKGTQTFDTDKSLWPLNKPIPKLEALIQCSGEARYSNDIPSNPREVYVSFVLSTIFSGDIESFDASDALKLPGVIAFYTAKDIPGKNSFTPTSVPWQEFDEEILASHILYCGQPIGVIAAVTEQLANKAADLVKVVYKNVSNKKPVLNIKDALAAPKSENRIRQEVEIKPESKGNNVEKIIKGTYNIGSQYHYTMEPQTCVVLPEEDSYNVYASTQWMDLVNVAVANCINVPDNLVNVIVSRVGGGYGGKASRSALVACACALVAKKLNRPARMVLSIKTNMAAIGMRQPFTADYEVGIDKNGLLQYTNITYYNDCGCNYNDTSAREIATSLTNLYETSRWHIIGSSVLTDKPSNTWCRSPATTEATALMEHLMERIAHTINKDSTDIKIMHLAPKHFTLKDMITSFKLDCDFDARTESINKYNKNNCWRKRAIKLSIMSFPLGYVGGFGVTVSVYHADGTVALSHGGIEMGQGINTKVAQVCAHALNIPLEKIAIKASNSFVSPNAMASNGSMTSECVAYATLQACNELSKRLQPIRDDMTDPTWEEIVSTAFKKGLNLQSSYLMTENDDLKGYNIYGVTIAEVELDVLTGRHQVNRVDILEDTGQSLSPEIDVGQIEGAFIMGLGLWTSENIVFSERGHLLTDRTWTYKPLGAKDIPVDFRINFKRNSFNTAGVLRSKATGEPALIMAVVVTHALHEAIMEARKEYGYNDTEWLHVENPYTVDNILQAISPKIEKFKLI